MTQEHREGYAKLLELLEDHGYTVVEEKFSSDEREPEFNADLWLVPPKDERGS